MEQHLARDIVEFGRSGRRYTRAEILAVEVGEIHATLQLRDLRIRRLGGGVVLVTYQSEVDRLLANRSSISRLTDAGWQMEFHQGTPTFNGPLTPPRTLGLPRDARGAACVWQTSTMPGGSAYPGPVEALEGYRAVVEASGNGEVKGAKNPYTSRNGHMFSFLDAEGTMALRFSAELEAEFRSQYESGPVVQYGRTMRGYSSVPSELLDDTEALREWYDRAWTWIGTLKPKPTK